jgi:hypothetical protein
MANLIVINTIAFVEVFIGLFTLAGMALYMYLGLLAKPPNVLTFVTVAAVASAALGLGLFRRKRAAATLLIFFSGYIILTKLMVFTGLMRFNGEILASLPTDLKSIVSTFYHLFVIVFLTKPSVQNELLR